MPSAKLQPVLRSAVSYLPSSGLLRLREMRDLPARVRKQPHEADFGVLRSWRLERPVVIDVGANRGQSIRSFRWVTTDPMIHSIEPNPFLVAHLRKVYRSDPRVDVRQLGLGDRPGTFELYLPRYGHTVYDTRASLGPEAPAEFLEAASFAWFRSERAVVERVEVPVATLDGLGLEPDLVKIDVEGMDDRVVAGGAEVLARSRPLVLVELPQPSTTSQLADLGYTPHAYDPAAGCLHAGREGDLNTYFLLPEHLEELDVPVR